MTEIVIVLFVAVLVFGAAKIPAIGDAIGRAVRGARDAGAGADATAAPRDDRAARR
jgi:sec-independent protein translocase protein TatA